MNKPTTIQLFKNIKTLVEQSRSDLYRIANTTLVEIYFHIGRMIVEYEQQGSSRAAYAKQTLKNLSEKLTVVLGKGFSTDNLENMRKLYLAYKDVYNKFIAAPAFSKSGDTKKSETLSRKSPFVLNWSHYLVLLNIEDSNERKFYETESVQEQWRA